MACSLSVAPLASFACWRGRSTAGPSHYRTLRAPRRELWYPPSNAMGRFNEAADPQMALAARAERPRVLRLHTDLKIALPGLEEDQRREAGLRTHRLWRDGLHLPSHRRISVNVLSRRRCPVLVQRRTHD